MSYLLTTVTPGSPVFPETAALFDEYRIHYGQPTDPATTTEWLSTQLTEGTLNLTTALYDGRPTGFITTVRLPASLRLGTICSIRDLYVTPASRHTGTARALLTQVITEARAAGALRVSLQTEPQNSAALALYTSMGFHQVHDLTTLNLLLTE
ncbi:MAG TPA: GNAT family N-acetyltransferase [Actinoplanes sp.]|nr:GNAT family N-acetyltransferase [Actinoplanes sp.]